MAWLADKAIDGHGNKLQLYAEEIEVSTEGNYSRIHAWLDLNVVSGGSVASSGMVAKVTGGENNIGYHYYGSGTHRLVDGYFYVTHASDGSGSAYVEGSFSAYIGSWGLSGTLWLTKISRYPYLNSGKNFKDNENPVFDITGFGDYPIRVRLEAGGSQIANRDLSSRYSQTYTLQLTDAERTQLRSLMTGDSLPVRYVVCALSGGNEVYWSWKDYTMTRGSHYVKVRVNGNWKDAIPYVRVNGQWKEAIPYTRVNGNWKEGI